jgi:predicted hotdog family 3-hydroxylacyl-ACP dehydratase
MLPGVALLDLVLRVLDSRQPLVRLDVLRLRSVVLPGERLEIDADDGSRWTVRRGDEIVAQAAVAFGSQPPAEVAPAARSAPGGWDLDALMPHRPPMRLVTGIDEVRDDGVVCTACLAERGPFTLEGPAPALVAIEMAAQAAAVFAGLRAAEKAVPRAGYLVGARDVRFFRAGIPAGTVCTAAVRAAGGAGALSAFEFEVACGGDSVAAGSLSTWLTSTGA